MRLVFLGSPPFATPILGALLASEFRPELVVTPPDRRRGRGRKLERSEVAALAEEAGVPVLQPETVRDPAVLERLSAVEADVFLVASYGEFLRREFLELPRVECLNVHPSLLPRHRGATPVQATVLAGDEVAGVSIQRVVLELDAGDVLTALETPSRRGETAGELAERLADLGAEASLRALRALADGSADFTPQDPERVTTCRKLEKADGAVDWTRPALELERHVLAMNPWPGARTAEPGGRELTLLRARALDGEATDAAPGTVLASAERLLVATGDGVLEVTELKPAGKRALDAADYLRGARLEAGTRLGAPQEDAP